MALLLILMRMATGGLLTPAPRRERSRAEAGLGLSVDEFGPGRPAPSRLRRTLQRLTDLHWPQRLMRRHALNSLHIPVSGVLLRRVCVAWALEVMEQSLLLPLLLAVALLQDWLSDDDGWLAAGREHVELALAWRWRSVCRIVLAHWALAPHGGAGVLDQNVDGRGARDLIVGSWRLGRCHLAAE